jgi:ABC-type nitrate/sulfonate/bicarbonate transport system permease component
MMAAILMLALIATVLDSTVMALRRWVTRWADSRGDAQ